MSKHGEKQYKKETYKSLAESTQTFPGIGLLEAREGDVILRGRNGLRDYLYPLEKAIRRYYETKRMVAAMAKNGIRGWDTLMDIQKEMLASILEAFDQRELLGRPCSQTVRAFVEKERDSRTVHPVDVLENRIKDNDKSSSSTDEDCSSQLIK